MKTEKLNALADEAGFEITPWGNESLPCVHQEGPIDVELKKFARLIVAECTSVVEGGSFLHDQAPTAVFARECSAAIKRHFGVEE
jgi:hypothetical protein